MLSGKTFRQINGNATQYWVYAVSHEVGILAYTLKLLQSFEKVQTRARDSLYSYGILSESPRCNFESGSGSATATSLEAQRKSISSTFRSTTARKKRRPSRLYENSHTVKFSGPCRYFPCTQHLFLMIVTLPQRINSWSHSRIFSDDR